MNREEIFNQRREIAQRLLRPLRMDGHLGAARDFSTRPYADGEKKYRFSMANYLRLAASEHFRSGLSDPRWYTMEDISRNGWTLKENADSEKLEVWTKSSTGEQICNLVDFYHAGDVDGKAPFEGKEVSLADTLKSLQSKNLLVPSNQISLRDGMYAVKDYALAHGGNELSAVMAAQMWLTESGILSNAKLQKELYSDEIMETIEKNPDALFAAAHQAQGILKKLEQEPAREVSPAKDVPFSDLEVCYFWSECNIKNIAGKIYPMDTVLTGEAAYEFLVQFNALDKQSFNEKITGEHGYSKSEIAIKYKNYDHGDMRIDISDLELGNGTTIADALVYRLDMYRQDMLKDPAIAKQHLMMNSRMEESNVTLVEFLEEVKGQSDEFHTAMTEFRREETVYLAAHPELVAINQEKADMYLYAVRAEDYDKLPHGVAAMKVGETIPEGHLLKDTNFAVRDFIATYREGEPAFYQNSQEQGIQERLSSDSVILFASGWSPDNVSERIRRKKCPPLYLSISPEEQDKLQRLNHCHLSISREAPLGIDGHKRAMDYEGFTAVRMLNDQLRNEEHEARTAVQSRFSLRGEQMEVSFHYYEDLLIQAKYESGKQELFRQLNEKGDYLPQELREAIAVTCKYLPYDSRPTEILKKEMPMEENFPTMEESRENYIKDCHSDLDPKDYYRLANYYNIVTLLDPEVATTEDFCRSIVEEMTKDGVTAARMKKITEHSIVHNDVKEKLYLFIQSPNTKAVLRKERVQGNESPDGR